MRKTSISCENVGSCAVLSVSYAEAGLFFQQNCDKKFV